MYTFNLSTFDKQTKLKQKLKEKESLRKGGILGKIDGPISPKADATKPEEPKKEEVNEVAPVVEPSKVLVASKSQGCFS
jgi:hypothetical protein